MKNAIIFSTGIVTGVIATPLAVIYVKPVYMLFGKGVSRLFVYAVTKDPEFRKIIHKGYDAFKDLEAECEKKEVRNADI